MIQDAEALHLDAGSVPSSATVAVLVVADPHETYDGGREPAEGREEREGDDSLELSARVVTADSHIAPGEDITASPVGAVEVLSQVLAFGQYQVHQHVLMRLV